MFKVALKNLLRPQVPLLLTALAVIARRRVHGRHVRAHRHDQQGFDHLFADVNQGVDAVVRQKAAFEVSGGFISDQRDESRSPSLDDIAAVDGVESADASIQGFAFIIDDDGTPLNPPEQAPQFGSNWPASRTEPVPAGRGPAAGGPNEAVIDQGSAEKGDHRGRRQDPGADPRAARWS